MMTCVYCGNPLEPKSTKFKTGRGWCHAECWQRHMQGLFGPDESEAEESGPEAKGTKD